MSTGYFLGGVAVLIGAAFVYAGALVGTLLRTDFTRPRAALVRRAKKAEQAAIATAPPAADIGVRGVVTADALLTGPVTGRPCVLFVVTLEERHGLRWVAVAEVVSRAPFRIADASSDALVLPEEGVLVTGDVGPERASPDVVRDPTIRDWVAALHGNSDHPIRVTERVVKDGAHCRIFGWFRPAAEPSGPTEPRVLGASPVGLAIAA